MNRRRLLIKHLLVDFIAAMLAWSLFYTYRKLYVEPQKFGSSAHLEFNETFFLGLLLVPTFWLLLYTVLGAYQHLYRKSRLRELTQTAGAAVLGTTALFFLLLLDDEIASYKNYYSLYGVLFALHFGWTALGRLLLATRTVKNVHNRKIGFNTLIVGGNENAVHIYQECEQQPKSSGFRFCGYVTLLPEGDAPLSQYLPNVGSVEDIREIIQDLAIEEVIVAMESSEHQSIGRIINALEGTEVFIKIIPDMYDILSGSVKMTSIFGAPLIAIEKKIMPTWQMYTKRLMDIVVSFCMLTIGLPVYLVIALVIKLSSKGPILYSHTRIGRFAKPFTIYKFRSMVIDAESGGPALSSSNDTRITKVGAFLRKTRLDELPQFFNVLKGDMSIVGPRPERQYFIDQIVLEAPHYAHLHKVRPGITSWGQVKYGYAENIEQMVERLKYDVLYIENMSLTVDIKILIYTVLIVLQRRGK